MFREAGIPTVYLTRLERKHVLEKVSRGVYSVVDAETTEMDDIVAVTQRSSYAVISLLSALAFHNIGTQNPFEVWVAIPNNQREPQLDNILIRTMRYSKESYQSGVEIHSIDGYDIKIYSPAKTVADCFKFRNKIGIDVAKEALVDGWNNKAFTMDELWNYGKVCRVTEVMRPYMEMLS